jgi:hypothetical protein
MTERRARTRLLGVIKIVVTASLPIPLEGRLRQHAIDADLTLAEHPSVHS